MRKEDLEKLRRQYGSEKLDQFTVDPSPIEQFRAWFKEALEAEIADVSAMTIATVNEDGRPSSRIVLLKGFDESGFIFFTNYQSSKGQHLATNPFAALNFYWNSIDRQIRIEGKVSRISPDESDRYFYSRPVGSQIGAIASPQSTVITSRHSIEEKVEQIKSSGDITRPLHWGGYILIPDLLEFWQGKHDRLHDRIQYRFNNEKEWIIERLAP